MNLNIIFYFKGRAEQSGKGVIYDISIRSSGMIGSYIWAEVINELN
ncbi:hypothetical protein NTGBS_730004 [Candidatus Nitrotoga sp. BS]|nr:hypothetical protein NTGBS_730004 [Candidatus Nitrotoga sp. BS]